ncbi:hypothetical protein PLESTM_000794300 [Pleodorina starrii]|nr:hypothetical protein PLESTM_000794300 [Pleodorina starrii]
MERAQYLFNTETCDLVVAKIGDELIGHVFVTKFEYPGHGSVCWITQVVVSASHRSHGIGSRLCRIAWSSCTNDFACGLVSSHPHAVRALECATERLCDLDAITEHAAGLIEASDIPYMQNRRVVQHTVDTQFYVDHTEVNQLIKKQVNWTLGELADGHEFFAFTFMSSPRRRGSGSGSLTGSPPKHTKVSSQE